MPKLRFGVLTTAFGFTRLFATLVERFLYMFEEVNVFTSLNTANINIGTVPECSPCMTIVKYSSINMC